MKSIENKETTIENVGQNGEEIGKCRYSDLIDMCLKQPKQGGFDWTDMENRLAIGKVTKSANGTIDFEDAHFTYLKKLVEGMKWAKVHEDLLMFKEDILKVK